MVDSEGSLTRVAVALSLTRLARLSRLGLGAGVLGSATLGRAVLGRDERPLHGPGEDLPVSMVLDTAIGLADLLSELGSQWLDTAGRTLAPVTDTAAGVLLSAIRAVAAPAVESSRGWWEPLRERGQARREQAERETTGVMEATLPQAMDMVLDRVDMAEVVVTKVDLEALMAAVFAQVDIVDVLTQNVDMERVVRASLQSVDLTGLALDHLDFDRVVSATLSQTDLVAVLREQLEEIDVAELLVTTPGAVAGGAVRQTTEGAERVVSGVLGLMGGLVRGPAAPAKPQPEPAEDGSPETDT